VVSWGAEVHLGSLCSPMCDSLKSCVQSPVLFGLGVIPDFSFLFWRGSWGAGDSLSRVCSQQRSCCSGADREGVAVPSPMDLGSFPPQERAPQLSQHLCAELRSGIHPALFCLFAVLQQLQVPGRCPGV
jgi:hypothetical protein